MALSSVDRGLHRLDRCCVCDSISSNCVRSIAAANDGGVVYVCTSVLERCCVCASILSGTFRTRVKGQEINVEGSGGGESGGVGRCIFVLCIG